MEHKQRIAPAHSSKLFITACLLALGLGSCQKDVKTKPNAETFNATVSAKQQNLNFRPLNTSDANLLLFPQDANYEKIDMAVYAFGNVLKGLLTQDMVNFIVSQVQANPERRVSFTTIFNQFPTLQNAMNQGLANQSITTIPYDFSSVNKILAVLQRNGITYELGINIPNLGLFSSHTVQVLTPGLELSDEAGHEDQIMGWFRQNGTNTPVRIDENEAMTFAVAVLNVHLNPIGGVPPINTVPIGGPIAPGGSYSGIDMINIRPWFKFEKKSKSEIWLHAMYYWTGPSSWYPLYSPALSSFVGYGKSLVTTADMGNWHYVNTHMSNLVEDVIWNVYERDWWESFKRINQLGGTVTYNWGAPMRFYGEVYGIDPANNHPNNTYTPAYMGTYRSTIISNMPSTTYLNGFSGNANFNFNAF